MTDLKTKIARALYDSDRKTTTEQAQVAMDIIADWFDNQATTDYNVLINQLRGKK